MEESSSDHRTVDEKVPDLYTMMLKRIHSGLLAVVATGKPLEAPK
jgi:hypothetical protein